MKLHKLILPSICALLGCFAWVVARPMAQAQPAKVARAKQPRTKQPSAKKRRAKVAPSAGASQSKAAAGAAGSSAAGVPAGGDAGRVATRRALARGEPLLIQVVVALCDKSQIYCGEHGLGNPASLRTNLYWGAMFGAKRFFGKRYGYEQLPQPSVLDARGKPGKSGLLERAVYRRWIDGARWGLPGRKIEQLTAVDAVHGAYINRAVLRFHHIASRGAMLHFRDGERSRKARVRAVGYAGHNRMMDGLRLPAAPPAEERAPVPSFVLACKSDNYFSKPLRAAGSKPLVTTSSYMAPEGYVVEAAVRATAEGRSAAQVRAAVVAAYAKWQKISSATAGRIFAPTRSSAARQ